MFLEAFDNIVFLPGNRHTGMNMLQTLSKLFWTDLVKPLIDILGWKRIAKDVRACYYQASQLVKYMHNVVSSYLIRSLLEESARASPDARIRPLSHASVDWVGGAESVGSNYFS
jgi:hypothetical protein